MEALRIMKKINLGFLFSLLMVPAAFAAVSITPKATAQASASQSSQASHAKPVSARAATGVHGGLLSSKSSGVKSNRSASTSKMSIGKYLGSSISKTNPGASMVTPGSPDMSRYATQDQIDNLLSMIDAINDSVSQAQTDVGAELANKADKVGGAVSGNLAGLDNTGNLTDSGVDPDTLALTADVDDKLSKKQNTLPTGSDGQVLGFTSGAIGWITPAVTDVSGKANLQTGAVAGNLAKINASGQYVDSGMSENDFATTTDVSNKQDKLPTGGGSGQVLSVDSSGNFTWVNQTTGKTYTGGDGIDINSADTISVKAATDAILGGVKLGSSTEQTVAANTVSSTADRSYAVQTNSGGQLLVNVPWTDKVPTGGSSGQVLGVGSSGNPEWVNQSSTDVSLSESGGGYVITNVSENDNAITVTKDNVKIPSGSETSTTYVPLWVE
jgi:hypothetical protein